MLLKYFPMKIKHKKLYKIYRLKVETKQKYGANQQFIKDLFVCYGSKETKYNLVLHRNGFHFFHS